MNETMVAVFQDFLADALCQIDRPDALTEDEQLRVAQNLAGCIARHGEVYIEQISDPGPSEADALKAELRKEKSKIVCRPCGGRGSIYEMAGPWHSHSQCDRCNGEGKVLP